MKRRRLVGCVVVVVGLGAAWPAAARSDGPPTVAEELAAMRLADPALTIELVAAEPDVRSPVAVAWDERGRMYVAEMLDYPTAESGGAIKRLEDRDRDGRYEHVTTFADGFHFPNGVLPWRGGLLVTAAPDIWFLKDHDDDGVADERRVVLTGFAEGNQQLRVNGLTWGLDNWIYGANGRSGGAIRRPDDPPEKAVPIPRHDFRFQPETGAIEALAGFSQFGLPRDDWGNRFPSWNTVPIRHVVLEEREAARNPFFTDAATVAEILDPADGGRIYSQAPPPTTFNSEPVAFFNASCGPTIYRGDLLPEAYRGDAFVCEPLTSLVHHRDLVPSGPTFIAKRVEPGREFLASTHSWFRPVNLATGPDGAFYVVDFCRAMVEHPAFVHGGKDQGVDFREGHEFGRIWRIRPTDSRPAPPRDLAGADVAELVAALGHPGGWWRDTAQRLLVERRDARAVAPLQAVLRSAESSDRAALHALAVLDGLGALDDEALASALQTTRPAVAEHALRLAAGRPGVPSDRITPWVKAESSRVRFRAAVALGDRPEPAAVAALAEIAGRDAADPWMRRAVLSGVRETAGAFLDALLAAGPGWLEAPTDDQAQWLVQVAEIIAARGDRGERQRLLALMAGRPGEPGRLALLAGLTRTAAPAPDELQALAGLLDRARIVAADAGQPVGHRVHAAQAIARSRTPGAGGVLAALLEPSQPQELQSAAVRLLSETGSVDALRSVVDRWTERTRTTRRELLAALVRSPATAAILLDGVEAEQIPPLEIDPAARAALAGLPDADLQARIERLLKGTEPAADRAEVIHRYEVAVRLEGDPTRGAAVFERNCLTCHQRAGKGHRVGPDLASVAGRPRETLLTDILDPSREVAPDSMSFVVVTRNGQVLTGLIAEETPTAVKLRRAEAVEESIPRAEIAELRATGQSLMPVGLESALSPQDIADLIELLRRPAP